VGGPGEVSPGAKIVFPVWKEAGLSGDDFRDRLLQSLAPVLLDFGRVRWLRIAVVDSAVEPAAARRLENCQPLPDGVVSVYLSGAGAGRTDENAIATAIRPHVASLHGYQVLETEVIAHPVRSGQRVEGFCQVVFLQRPEHLTRAQWLELWQGSHTQVAIDTQATFAYRQNVITQALDDDAPLLHAMIEESFPGPAMTSDQAFYGVSNDRDLQIKQATMLDSCARFIDFNKIDVIPMSEYVFRG